MWSAGHRGAGAEHSLVSRGFESSVCISAKWTWLMDGGTERDTSRAVKSHSSLKRTREQPRVLESIEHGAMVKEHSNKE